MEKDPFLKAAGEGMKSPTLEIGLVVLRGLPSIEELGLVSVKLADRLHISQEILEIRLHVHLHLAFILTSSSSG